MSIHGIKVTLNLDDSLPVIRGHSTQMEQVIIDLISNSMNALKAHSRENKMISICTKSVYGNCILEVLDNSPDISPKYLEQIFDPFLTTKITGESMGLGLSIARNFINCLGGIITAENRKEGGAYFTIYIPVASSKKEGE